KRIEKALRFRWLRKKIAGSADGMFLEYYSILTRVVKQQKFDFVILENLLTLHAVSVIRKCDRSVSIIYDAHNVDSSLVEQSLRKNEADLKHLKKVQKTEGALHKKVDAILACSEQDRIRFLEMNDNKVAAIVIPNGVSIERMYDKGVNQDLPEYILFCGALWTQPNSEGLIWFYKNIWPGIRNIFPLLKLLIVGSGKLPVGYDEIYQDTSLVFTGSVEDVKPWYDKASIAIVPLLSGSGTRLKILEAMSLGLPVISTSKGAEGINYTKGVNIIIADEENKFEEKIINLLKDKEQRLSIQQHARTLVKENYNWDIIGDSLAGFINMSASKKPRETLKINFSSKWQEFENHHNQFTDILSQRYDVVISDDPDFYFFTHSFYNHEIKDYLNYKCHRVFFGYENVRADWKVCDYVLDSDFYNNNPRHKRYPLWARHDLKKLIVPKDLEEFKSKKKFCCIVVSNPNAKERIDFFHKLSAYKKVDSGGRYLNNIGYAVPNKQEFIKDYKFVISFENSSYAGYATEKIVEPMLVNSIPIYWGDPAIKRDFNTKSFININDFKSYDEAIEYIIQLDANYEKYLEVASQPWLNDNKIKEEFLEESLLNFFDFILKDSKRKKPVSKSLYLNYSNRFKLLKYKFASFKVKLNTFFARRIVN
ncbi:MAG TPA: glycosyltransferase family 10, partial [Hanamia sp.]|nr:glycosyltransferase family 10 [Hanamia sp.]